MASPTEDRELIQRLGEGDLEALGTLYDRYRLIVFRTALAITHDRDAAEDILQECFLKLNAYARRIDLNLPLEPWLYRVTVNLAYTWVSRRSRWVNSLESFIDRLVAPIRTTSEYHFERAELQQVIQRSIDSLPPGQRMTVILYYLNDLSLKEISFIMECPVGTVKSRLHYGREYLKRCLAPYHTVPRLEPAAQHSQSG